jgi:hypothetical protein
MIADRSRPRQFAHCKSPVNPGLASLSPGTGGAAALRTAPDERVRPRLLETVMPHATSDSAPLNASAWRVRWRLHVVPAGLQGTAASCVGERIRHIQRRLAPEWPPRSRLQAKDHESLTNQANAVEHWHRLHLHRRVVAAERPGLTSTANSRRHRTKVWISTHFTLNSAPTMTEMPATPARAHSIGGPVVAGSER